MFRKLLYILLLVNALSLLPIIYELYAYDGLVGTRGWNTDVPLYRQGSYALINILSHPANGSYWWVFLVFVFGQVAFLILGLLRKFPRLSAVMVFFFTINLNHKGYLAFTGGEVLVHYMLFYLMFIHQPKDKEGGFGIMQNVLNNTFYWILLGQVCVLYLMSGMYKLFDEHWVAGEAMMYVSRIETFESFMTQPFQNSPFLSAIATYSALVYQLLFSVLVWFRRIKIPFLLFGVLFHLVIAFGMGLFTFGMIMILSYFLFLDEDQIERLKGKFFRRKAATESA